DRPGGYSFECELVGFQTAYSALVPGDYEKCVTNFYGSHANWPKVRIVAKLDPAPVDPVDPPVDGQPAWDASKVYTAGSKVSYKGAVYQAKWWTQGDDPAKGGPWVVVPAK
ncbi:TPA: carbohydrate-binding protein, partial [Aeromonas veronii]